MQALVGLGRLPADEFNFRTRSIESRRQRRITQPTHCGLAGLDYSTDD